MMNLVTDPKRGYHSEARAQQVQATRAAIVNATAALLSEDRRPTISIPEVAAAAGVGVATVYRHFSSRDDLFDAVYDQWMSSAREVLADEPHRDLDHFLAVLPELWRRQGEHEALAEAMSSYTPAGRLVRTRRRDRRRAVATTLLATQSLDDRTRQRISPLVLLLTSTTAHKHLRDHWDLDEDESAELVGWAIKTLIHAASHEKLGS